MAIKVPNSINAGSQGEKQLGEVDIRPLPLISKGGRVLFGWCCCHQVQRGRLLALWHYEHMLNLMATLSQTVISLIYTMMGTRRAKRREERPYTHVLMLSEVVGCVKPIYMHNIIAASKFRHIAQQLYVYICFGISAHWGFGCVTRKHIAMDAMVALTLAYNNIASAVRHICASDFVETSDWERTR